MHKSSFAIMRLCKIYICKSFTLCIGTISKRKIDDGFEKIIVKMHVKYRKGGVVVGAYKTSQMKNKY